MGQARSGWPDLVSQDIGIIAVVMIPWSVSIEVAQTSLAIYCNMLINFY